MKTHIVYFETGEIMEFFPGSSRAWIRRTIRKNCDDGQKFYGVRPRYRFTHPWSADDARKEFGWY